MQQAFIPVQLNERISIMDSLRGIAILGIFIANLGAGFSFYDATLNNSGPFFHPLDKTFQFWQHVFIEGKFYSIFSLLFGWGMAIQLKRSEAKGLTPVKFMRRRLTFMFLLGLAHLLLLWTGDIVAFYSLVGFVFLWIRKWSDRKLFITAIVMLCLPVLIYFLRMKWNVLLAPAGLLYGTGTTVDSYLTGSKSFDEFLIKLKTENYFFQLKSLVAGVFYRFGDLIFQSRPLKVLGMFILGYLLGRNDRYTQLIANKKLLWTIAGAGLAIGLPANYQLSKLMETGLYYQLKIEGFYQSIAYALGVAPLALAYVSLFFLFAQTVIGKKITAVLPVKSFEDEDKYVFMATSLGTVKKSKLSDFSRPMKRGIIAVNLDEGDFLIGAAMTNGTNDVMLFSDSGKAVRFDENDVRAMGRNARGVRGMNLEEGQRVIAMLVAESEQQSVLTATENGFGKRTPVSEYTRHGRGTKGMIAIQTSERNGKVVSAVLVNPTDEIMLITTGGVLVRTRVSEIREMGRATQGVTLISVDEGTWLSGLQRIVESDAEDLGEVEEGDSPDAPAATEE